MFAVTFYSYKGGVGRTLALANVADRLRAKGKKVFLLDFDLEAPGLDSFFDLENASQPGILEYVNAFSESGVVPNLKGYVTEVKSPERSTGSIHLMRAGRGDQQYQQLLAHLNWKEFYSFRHGFL